MCKCQTSFLTIHKSKNREALIFFQKFCEDDEKTLLRDPHKLQTCILAVAIQLEEEKKEEEI
jgi:hypothetical protein